MGGAEGELIRAWLRVSKDHALLLMDTTGLLIGWRGAAERIFQYTESEILGQPIAVLFRAEDQALGLPALELQIARDGGRSEDDRWHQRKDGSVFFASGTVTALHRHETGELIGFIKVLRDRTHAQAQLQQLHSKVENLRQQHEVRRSQIRSLAHELRNPLSPLLNIARVLLKSNCDPSLSPIIERQVKNLERLLDDLVQENTAVVAPPIEKRLLDLRQALDAAYRAYLPAAQLKRIKLDLLMPQHPVLVMADLQRIDQALANVFSNALKYTPAGGRVWCKCTVETRNAVVRVEDNGVGIDEATLPKIFNMFVRESTTQASGIDGEGIGLAVVRSIMLAHDGVVEVHSDGKGKGSEFSLRLPLYEASDGVGYLDL